MKRIITTIDKNGRVHIPSSIREKYKMLFGEKVILEINKNNIKIVNANDVVDEMHEIFTKNKTTNNKSIVDNFIQDRRKEFHIENSGKN